MCEKHTAVAGVQSLYGLSRFIGTSHKGDALHFVPRWTIDLGRCIGDKHQVPIRTIFRGLVEWLNELSKVNEE